MTEASGPAVDPIAHAEKLLAGHPDFGNAELIERRAAERLRFAWEILAERLPGIAALLPSILNDGAWPQLVRDPVVRRATGDAVERLHTGDLDDSDDLGEVLELAVNYITPGDRRVPSSIEEGARFWAGPGQQIWVLGFPTETGPLGSRLSRASVECFLEVPGLTGVLNPGTAHTVDLVDRAADLLTVLLPELGPGLLRHVTALGTITAESGLGGTLLSINGGSTAPGTIGIRPAELENPWNAAGRLLHESLHLRIFGINTYTPLFSNMKAATETRIQVPWRTTPWELRRILSAFHVYAHMMLFDRAAKLRGAALSDQFGNPPENPGVSILTDDSYAGPGKRLSYLAEQLLGPLAQGLTAAGRRFVQWQLAAIAPLTDVQLPPARRDDAAADLPEPLSQAGYEQAPGLKVRRCKDLGLLLAFNPSTRVLHSINPAGWIAFELCDGRMLDELRTAYARVVSVKATDTRAADRQLAAALTQLGRTGLIKPTSSARSS
jgi:hypothetical protein